MQGDVKLMQFFFGMHAGYFLQVGLVGFVEMRI